MGSSRSLHCKGSAKPGSPNILSCAETPPADFGPLWQQALILGGDFRQSRKLYIPLVILVSNNSVGVPKAINFPSLTFELFDMLSGDFPNVVR